MVFNLFVEDVRAFKHSGRRVVESTSGVARLGCAPLRSLREQQAAGKGLRGCTICCTCGWRVQKTSHGSSSRNGGPEHGGKADPYSDRTIGLASVTDVDKQNAQDLLDFNRQHMMYYSPERLSTRRETKLWSNANGGLLFTTEKRR